MLSVNHVSKQYAGKKALDDVSLQAEAGSVLGLLGPNGAGKTSLIRIITMITAPDEGEVLFNGQKMHSGLLSSIGYLPEERGLYRKMSIQDQALFFGRLKGLDTKTCQRELDAWSERLDMTGWKKKRLDELSKGMQQKVQFVLTVLHKPRLLILDEPFTGFDPVNAEIIKQEILRLRDEGAAILLSTHRMESVEELCDRISLINNSRMILEGPVNEVRERYRIHEFALEYSGELPRQGNTWTLISQEHKLDGKHRAVISCEEDQRENKLLKELSDLVHIHSFTEKLPSIKEIFIQTVAEKS